MRCKSCCCCYESDEDCYKSHEDPPEGGATAVSQFKHSDNYNFSDDLFPHGNVEGVPVPFFTTPKVLAEVQEKFKLRAKSDIFIVTYPKSGTTWTQKIVRELLFDGDVKPYCDMSLIDRMPDVVNPYEMKLDVVEGMPSPRVFKCHMNRLEFLDKYLLKGEGLPRFIYVMRDPRDVSVSLFCHLVTTKMSDWLSNASFDDFHKKYMRDGNEVFYGLWENHVDNWLSRRSELDMLVLRYENMKVNPRKEIKRIADFLGLDPTSEKIEDVAGKTTINYMKKEANVLTDETGRTGSVLRTGKVGDWKNFFVDKEEADKLAKIADQLYDKHGLKEIKVEYLD